jgi:small-conductance mechanosensitive channel
MAGQWSSRGFDEGEQDFIHIILILFHLSFFIFYELYHIILYELHWRRRRQRRARGSRKEKQGVLTVVAAVPLEQKRLPLTLHGAGVILYLISDIYLEEF